MVFASTSRLLASFARPAAFGTLRSNTSTATSSFNVSNALTFGNTMRYFSSSNIAQASPRTKHLAQHGSGGKLKSHTGTKKRWSPLGSGSGKAYQLTFKRGLAGKRHLNSGMARDRLNNLGGTVLSPRGRINRTLRRLLGPSL